MQDAAAVAAAERIKAQAGARVHRLGQPEELKEDAMPRKPGTEPNIVKVKVPVSMDPDYPKNRGRPPKSKGDGYPPDVQKAVDEMLKAPPSIGTDPRALVKKATPRSLPRFGVFDDGSISINLPGCKGRIASDEAREFVAFLGKIGVRVKP